MQIIAFLLPPILGAIIALSTNWIAIKMLFRPHKEKRIFGLRLPFTPGLIPRERSRLARKLGDAISTHLLTPDILADRLADPTVWPLPDSTFGEVLAGWGITDPVAYVSEVISSPAKKAVDAVLPKAIEGLFSLPERFPELDSKLGEFTANITNKSISSVAKIFVKQDKIYPNIKEALFTYLAEPENQEAVRGAIHSFIDNLLAADIVPGGAFPQIHEAKQKISARVCAFHIREGAQLLFTQEPYASIIRRILEMAATYLATHMPISAMIEQKMSGLDVAETEKVILGVVGRELKLIIWLGGLFGFIIGLLSLVL